MLTRTVLSITGKRQGASTVKRLVTSEAGKVVNGLLLDQGDEVFAQSYCKQNDSQHCQNSSQSIKWIGACSL